MQVPVARQAHQLVLGKFSVDECQHYAMKTQVPGRVPGVFPLVGHGDYVGVVEVDPIVVPTVTTLGRRRWLRRVSLQPLADVVTVELLAPDHSGQRLTLHGPGIGIREIFLQFSVKRVGLGLPLFQQGVESGKRVGLHGIAQ